MPYLHCPSCRLATFSVAFHSTRDECPRCGIELTAHPRRLFAVPDPDPRFESAGRDASPEVV